MYESSGWVCAHRLQVLVKLNGILAGPGIVGLFIFLKFRVRALKLIYVLLNNWLFTPIPLPLQPETQTGSLGLVL